MVLKGYKDHSKPAKAFTLLEMLVIIVILGVVFGSLVPVIGKVREQGRRVLCLNNLRQHGVAWHLYLEDNNYVFPLYTNPPSQTSALGWYFGGKHGSINNGALYAAKNRPLNRYLDVINPDNPDDESSAGFEVFHCPDDATGLAATGNTSFFNYYGNSYFLNQGLFFNASGLPTAYSDVTYEKNKVAVEFDHPNIRPGHGGKGPTSNNTTPIMVLFVDGHVGGPFLYNSEFDATGADRTKKVSLSKN